MRLMGNKKKSLTIEERHKISRITCKDASLAFQSTCN